MQHSILFLKAVLIYLICGLMVGFSVAQANNPLPLMPWPQSVVVQEGRFEGYGNFNIAVSGDEMGQEVDRWAARIIAQTGLVRPTERQLKTSKYKSNLIQIRILNKVAALPSVEMDERYQLEITPNGVLLTAETRFGALRGMETVLQLLQKERGIYLPCVKIIDEPRFAWRGIF
jgi:hexosaminidase